MSVPAPARHALERRERLAEKYPELAGDRRPVLAHEGRYATAPLLAGDPPHPHNHLHPRPHDHAHPHPHRQPEPPPG